MKVKITSDSKKVITWEQIDIAKRIVSACAEDDMKVSDYAEIAANAIARLYDDFCLEVFNCSAEIAGNARAWNRILEDSEHLDVWIRGTAKCYDHYIEFGAYLTDIWDIDGDNNEEIAGHMFKVVYKKLA